MEQLQAGIGGAEDHLLDQGLIEAAKQLSKALASSGQGGHVGCRTAKEGPFPFSFPDVRALVQHAPLCCG